MPRDEVIDLLDDPRYELLPFAGFEEQVEHLPDGAKVALTASPKKGLDLTIERATELADRGYEVSAHIAARSVRDEDHLRDIAERLTTAGISDIFVPGGDNEEPAGEFDSSYALLSALDELDYSFDEIGITGYPEGHAFIDDQTLAAHLEKKEPLATYIVTQLCFDAEEVLAWTGDIRDRGIDLPVHVGVPGVMKYQRLLNISSRIGVGDSIHFLRKTTGVIGFIRQLVGSRGKYTPDTLVEELARASSAPDSNIAGIHLYTFNQVPDTESWRRDVMGSDGILHKSSR